jgi:hypothetical protein
VKCDFINGNLDSSLFSNFLVRLSLGALLFYSGDLCFLCWVFILCNCILLFLFCWGSDGANMSEMVLICNMRSSVFVVLNHVLPCVERLLCLVFVAGCFVEKAATYNTFSLSHHLLVFLIVESEYTFPVGEIPVPEPDEFSSIHRVSKLFNFGGTEQLFSAKFYIRFVNSFNEILVHM